MLHCRLSKEHPNHTLLDEKEPPLMERNPLVFWQAACFVLVVLIAVLLCRMH